MPASDRDPEARAALGNEEVQALADMLVDETDDDAALELEAMLVEETPKD